MKHAPIDPLDPQLASLFRAARPVPPAGAKDRGRTRLHGALIASTATAGAASAAVGAAHAASAAGVGSALSSPILVATVALATATAAAVGGGLAWKAAQRPERPRTAPALAQGVGTPPVRPAPAQVGVGLAEEQRLVARARGALASGDVATATAALEQHERSFATGVLVEERETLWIVTLARRGDREAARDRARRFLELHPGSIHREIIEQAIAPRR